jgi:hypothetical protein
VTVQDHPKENAMKPAVAATHRAHGHQTPGGPPTPSDWVARFVNEEQQWDLAHERADRNAAQRATLVREHIHELMDALRDRVERDVDAFSRRLPDRAITIEDNPPGGGFIVRRGRYPEARLTVDPHPETGTIRIQYVFASERGTFTPKLREITVSGDSVAGLHFVEPHDSTTSWRTLNDLSECLLVPVFSGRPVGFDGENA